MSADGRSVEQLLAEVEFALKVADAQRRRADSYRGRSFDGTAEPAGLVDVVGEFVDGFRQVLDRFGEFLDGLGGIGSVDAPLPARGGLIPGTDRAARDCLAKEVADLRVQVTAAAEEMRRGVTEALDGWKVELSPENLYRLVCQGAKRDRRRQE